MSAQSITLAPSSAATNPPKPAIAARTKLLLEGPILPTLLRLSAPNVLNLLQRARAHPDFSSADFRLGAIPGTWARRRVMGSDGVVRRRQPCVARLSSGAPSVSESRSRHKSLSHTPL